jgi:hypothetical protein
MFHKFPKYHMKILLGDCSAKVCRKAIFKPTIGSEILHEIDTGNKVRVVNFTTSKNLIVKSTMFSYHNIHKFTWTFSDRQMHSQIDDILTDWRRHSSVLGL